MQSNDTAREPITSTRPDRFLRWPDLKPLVGVSRTTWWRMIRAGTAPKGIQVSANCVAWRAADIAAFQAAIASKHEAA